MVYVGLVLFGVVGWVGCFVYYCSYKYVEDMLKDVCDKLEVFEDD